MPRRVSIQDEVFEALQDQDNIKRVAKQRPNYWNHSPGTLCSTANVHSIVFGTGNHIYRQAILPAIEQAEHEVIIVTCFWARSATLDAVNDSLRKLSAKAEREKKIIRVRVCFSSSSIWQKLFQSQSLEGRIWHPGSRTTKLGLPSIDELPGLDLGVKSIFQLPFSVMHPKFIIVDRKFVLLPSCNVSWEDWFEGCITMSGDVVQQQFIRFWKEFWASRDDLDPTMPIDASRSQPGSGVDLGRLLASTHLSNQSLPTFFLPHPHQRFALPWITSEKPPPTPLNIYLLTLFRRAEHSIYIQTPNLTARIVISELLAALIRGVDVTILTSEKLMRLEQIVTAGTTTARSVKSLVQSYKRLRDSTSAPELRDMEAGLAPKRVGRLVVKYFSPRAGAEYDDAEPLQSHFKFTAVDGRIAVLGSGNMDRASWFTSQELGLALTSEEVVKRIEDCLVVAMEGRSRVVYDSAL